MSLKFLKTVRNLKFSLSEKIPIKYMQGKLYVVPEDSRILVDEFSDSSLSQTKLMRPKINKIG